MEKYLKTVNDGLCHWCPSCARERVAYVMVTDEGPNAGQKLTCCCFCQRIILSEPATAEELAPMSRYGGKLAAYEVARHACNILRVPASGVTVSFDQMRYSWMVVVAGYLFMVSADATIDDDLLSAIVLPVLCPHGM